MKRDYLLKIVDLLQSEFERILVNGFDKDSPFYDYLDDLRIVIGKINE